MKTMKLFLAFLSACLVSCSSTGKSQSFQIGILFGNGVYDNVNFMTLDALDQKFKEADVTYSYVMYQKNSDDAESAGEMDRRQMEKMLAAKPQCLIMHPVLSDNELDQLSDMAHEAGVPLIYTLDDLWIKGDSNREMVEKEIKRCQEMGYDVSFVYSEVASGFEQGAALLAEEGMDRLDLDHNGTVEVLRFAPSPVEYTSTEPAFGKNLMDGFAACGIPAVYSDDYAEAAVFFKGDAYSFMNQYPETETRLVWCDTLCM